MAKVHRDGVMQMMVGDTRPRLTKSGIYVYAPFDSAHVFIACEEAPIYDALRSAPPELEEVVDDLWSTTHRVRVLREDLQSWLMKKGTPYGRIEYRLPTDSEDDSEEAYEGLDDEIWMFLVSRAFMCGAYSQFLPVAYQSPELTLSFTQMGPGAVGVRDRGSAMAIIPSSKGNVLSEGVPLLRAWADE